MSSLIRSLLSCTLSFQFVLVHKFISAFEYVLLSDPKPAGFESADLLSAWTWNPVSMYREVRDAQTNFFINWLPAGKVTLRYVLRPTVPGQMNALPAQIQSMYAPEYGAHTETAEMSVVK